MTNWFHGGGDRSIAAGDPPSTGGRTRDFIPFVAVLATGLFLVSICHYSLEELSGFNAIVLAAFAGSKHIKP